MKFILKSLFTLLFLSLCIQAQVRNGDFEQWFGGEPVGWLTNNSSTENAYPITQTQNSYTGALAVKGTVIKINDPDFGPFLRNPQLSSISARSEAIPITTRPRQVRGYLMFQPKGDESFFIDVAVYINIGGQKKGLGYGSYTTTKYDSAYRPIFIDIDYLGSTAIPDSMVISCNINAIGSASLTEGSVFYLDDLEFSVTLISPIDNDIIISGEKDTIRWNGGNKKINLLYSTDDGNTFKTIETDYPADSEKYVWKVPKDLLSRKGKLRIEDSDNPDIKDERSVKFKPWQLTRVDANGDFELYQPDQDGWSFSSTNSPMWPQSWWQQFDYQNGTEPVYNIKYSEIGRPFSAAPSWWFPDWPLWVEAFRIPQCYKSHYVDFKSSIIWAFFAQRYKGCSYGFGITSLLYFYHKSSFSAVSPSLKDVGDLFSITLDTSIREVNNLFEICSMADPILSTHINNLSEDMDADRTLEKLKEMLGSDNADAQLLIYSSNISNRPGTHSVVPYRLERIGKTSNFNLKVYDSRAPGKNTHVILFDSLANTWTDETGSNWGTGSSGCFLDPFESMDISDQLLGPFHGLILHDLGSHNYDNTQQKRNYHKLSESSKLELWNTKSSDIDIVSSNGESAGYKDSILVNSISGAVPIIPITGYSQPPIGYNLPDGKYSVHLSNFKDSSSSVLFMTNPTIYSYRRDNANSNETDNLSYANGIGIENPDMNLKNINLETLIDEDSSEKDFETDNIQISQDDSIKIKEIDGKVLLLRNYGTEKNYDLHLRSASANGEKFFYHPRIQLSSNTSDQIVPNWDNLEKSSVKILIDIGNDGTIDDSIFVDNQTTDVNKEYRSNIPDNFQLYQNYPNPFNPTTKIKYSIPSVGTQHAVSVQLKIYDILGREVATLVNKQQQPGNYEVEFDASNLPAGRQGLSSGIYFYTLETAGFINTKKMLLLK